MSSEKEDQLGQMPKTSKTSGTIDRMSRLNCWRHIWLKTGLRRRKGDDSATLNRLVALEPLCCSGLGGAYTEDGKGLNPKGESLSNHTKKNKKEAHS